MEHVLSEVVHVGECLIGLHPQLWGNLVASREVAVTGNKVKTEKIDGTQNLKPTDKSELPDFIKKNSIKYSNWME